MSITRLLKTVPAMLALMSYTPVSAQLHWESMVIESDTWKYLAATSAPPADWYQNSFVDSGWKSGPGGLGYGDNDDVTVVPACNSLYLRTQVTVSDVSVIKDLVLDIDYDDAFVLYINGVECARSTNVTGTFPAYSTTLTTDHEAHMYSGGSPERFQLKPSSLVKGVNTFAVQILNQGITSSDMSARIFVEADINSTGTLYHSTPSWFTEPVSFETSNLPLIFINTNSQTIIQNTKIMADMKVLNSPSGLNDINDTTFEYNGKVGIEIRGFTSANFPKKSYSVETRNADSSNRNVELLGLPKENDWVFHGPYPDKSLMRNVLAYHLGNLTGKWSPHTHFFELYLNGSYNGVYALVEKIKIDKSRLNLAKLNPADTIGDQLTGGYIMKLDRPETTDVEGKDYWISPYLAPTSLQQKEYFLHVDPDGEKINSIQHEYIKNYITKFENAMYSDNYKDRTTGYYSWVDLTSFVDYYIINELAHNLDGYRISTFMYKDKDSKGGKLTMGPFWDYDICFGNADFFSAGSTSGWIVDGMGDGDAYAMPFWWKKLRLDPIFNSHLKNRWNELKNSFINTTYLNHVIDSCAYDLRDAQKRNFQTWNILGIYVWPNNYVGGTYDNELNYLKNWLKDRITWMDSQIQPIVDVTLDLPATGTIPIEVRTYPNPFIDQVNFKCWLPSGGDIEILIYDVLGKQVLQHKEMLEDGIHTIPLTINATKYPAGVFMYQVKLDGKIQLSGKLVRM
jgi:hypothetical protein